MKLLDARVNGMPRQVSTKYGEKAVLDVATSEGTFTVWRPAGDMEVMGRRNGERVSIAIDSKGKASLVEHCSTAPQQAQVQAKMGFTTESAPAESRSLGGSRHVGAASPKEICDLSKTETTRSAEIADYINRLGKLYSHCLTTAANMPTAFDLNAPQVKDIATTLFIQTTKHFNL
jgi:hypothetical protein